MVDEVKELEDIFREALLLQLKERFVGTTVDEYTLPDIQEAFKVLFLNSEGYEPPQELLDSIKIQGDLIIFPGLGPITVTNS